MSDSKSSKSGCLIFVGIIAIAVVWGLFDQGALGGGSAAGTGSDSVVDARESGRLIERLDAAAKTQGVCYGWRVDTGRPGDPQVEPSYSATFRPSPVPSATAPGSSPDPFSSSGPTAVEEPGVQTGSNLGAGTDPRTAPGQCPRWVILTADYTYSYTDETWTSVDLSIDSNLPSRPSTADLSAAGITPSSLAGDGATGRLADAVGALPMIVAEGGSAPAVPAAAPQTPPSGDRASSPGVARYVWMGVAALMILGGLTWIAVAAVRRRRASPPATRR